MYKLGGQNFESIAGHCHILANLKEGCDFTSNLYEGSKCMRPCGNWDGLRDTGGRDFCPKVKDQTKSINGSTPSIDVSTSRMK